MGELLRTISGIESVRSATIHAQIGNIDRFKNSKALASYAGLIPSVGASDNGIHGGGITKLGSRSLRHALVEASIPVPIPVQNSSKHITSTQSKSKSKNQVTERVKP